MLVRLTIHISQTCAHGKPLDFPTVLVDFEVPVWNLFFSGASSDVGQFEKQMQA